MTTRGGDAVRVVIGIDFGTSRSGYAFAFVGDDERVYGNTEWPGQPAPYPKTLTQVLYGPDGRLHAWGYEARQRLASLLGRDEARSYALLSNFKMELREATERRDGEPFVVRPDGRSWPVVELIADFLRELKQVALARVRAAAEVEEHEILWCLTIPAIWQDAEKMAMRRAAERAGLVDGNLPDQDRLLLVLEPEAAAMHCQKKELFRREAGTRFMVVDCGGGTVDLTAHEVLPSGELREIAPGTGGAHGSTYVDRNFSALLRQRLSPALVDRFHDEAPIDYVEMMATWERTKCGYNPEGSGETVYFQLPAKLYRLMLREYPQVVDELAERQNGDDSVLHLSEADLAQIFTPVLDQVAARVREQYARLQPRGCDVVFLVGGFAKSPLLRRHVEAVLPGVRLVVPPEPGGAVVEGAVAFGLSPEHIRSRRARYTYGCSSHILFEDGVDPPERKKWWPDRKAFFCEGRLWTFVEAGEEVGVNQTVTRSFFPMSNNQTSIALDFFVTPKKDARYVFDPQVRKVGHMEIKMPITKGGVRREVKVEMYFGRTEIEVKATDATSGNRCETRLQLYATYDSSPAGDARTP